MAAAEEWTRHSSQMREVRQLNASVLMVATDALPMMTFATRLRSRLAMPVTGAHWRASATHTACDHTSISVRRFDVVVRLCTNSSSYSPRNRPSGLCGDSTSSCTDYLT